MQTEQVGQQVQQTPRYAPQLSSVIEAIYACHQYGGSMGIINTRKGQNERVVGGVERGCGLVASRG